MASLGSYGIVTITQRGTLTFHSANGPKIRKIKLNNVPVIHGSPHDIIIGQSHLEPEGSQTIRIGTTLRIIDSSMTTIVTAEKSGALYYIAQPHTILAKSSKAPVASNKSKRSDRKSRASLKIWHQRLGHISYRKIEQIAKHGLIHGLELADHDRNRCIHCDMGKLPRSPANFFKAKIVYAPGAKLHSDLNTFPVATPGGCRYAMIFTDDRSRYSWVFLLKTREDLHVYIRKLAKIIFVQFKTAVQVVRADNEYLSNAITEHFAEAGIKAEYSPPYEKDFVGIAERVNRTVNESVRCMLHQAKMPKSMWGEAMLQAVYNKNRIPSTGIDGKITTPFEALTGTKPRALPLHTFGCLAVAKTFKPGDKLDKRGEECIFLGVNEDQNSYKLLSLEHKWKVINCFSVSFYETQTDNWRRLYEYATPTETRTPPSVELSETKSDLATKAEDHVSPDPSEVPSSNRTRRPYNEWRKDVIPYSAMNMETPPFEPDTFAEAINCDNRKEWQIAMQDEIDSLVAQGTWELVHAPKGAKIISCKWVYKVKMVNGKFERFKCRVVAKGFMQVYGPLLPDVRTRRIAHDNQNGYNRVLHAGHGVRPA
jgi:hypothetical protein